MMDVFFMLVVTDAEPARLMAYGVFFVGCTFRLVLIIKGPDQTDHDVPLSRRR